MEEEAMWWAAAHRSEQQDRANPLLPKLNAVGP